MKTIARIFIFALLAVFVQPALPALADETSVWDEFEFSAGEVIAYDAAKSQVQVKFYLDAEGRPSDSVQTFYLDDRSIITDGEKTLSPEVFAAGKPVDVEYEKATSRVTYAFVY